MKSWDGYGSSAGNWDWVDNVTDGNMIVHGSIGADQIAAKAITTDKLSVGMTHNLLESSYRDRDGFFLPKADIEANGWYDTTDTFSVFAETGSTGHIMRSIPGGVAVGYSDGGGGSYSASTGNHDDLVMNLVMFAWFVSSDAFGDMSDTDLKSMLYQDRVREMEDDVMPFGIINDRPTDSTTVIYEDMINDMTAWNNL